MIVLKFGGKSLGNKEKIKKIARYIKKRCKSEKLIVVVSAMSNTTDNLIALANKFAKKPNKRELDVLLSCGETISASLFSISLCEIGVKACSLLGWQAKIFTNGNFGNGHIEKIEKSIIEEKLEQYDCVVIAGFQGIDETENIITLGRGGSDTTAVALGATFKCDVEIYSDFNGICAGDPRRGNFKKYKQVDFQSALNYAETGAKVLSKSCTQIAKEENVKIICKSSEKPNLKGTEITQQTSSFVGINIKQNLSMIYLVSKENNVSRIKTLKYLLKDVNYIDIKITKDLISILIEQSQLEIVEKNISKLNNLLTKKTI